MIYRGASYAYWSTEINPPEGTWQHYAVTLTADNFTVAPAFETFDYIMSDVTALWIRGEYIGGPSDWEGLDNVVISAVPIAGPLWLLGSGLIALSASRRGLAASK
ncbi:MAG: hypothetical protein JRJ85_24135 [Deltaproteobacteria bacterium]|nr:hypothetical protein [Deltaproteobacteria bacterium]